MKNLIIVIITALLTFSISYILLSSQKKGSGIQDLISQIDKYKVEDVHIEKDSKTTWSVTGIIRNISNNPIKGSVKIKLINSKGDIINSLRARVNDGDLIDYSQGGYFSYSDDPSKFKGVVDFDVVFIEK